MTAGPRLLVVDDEPDICANLCDIFADLGYEVDAAHSGAEALKLVAREFYDVALLDLKMPGMDGVELYRRLKEASAGTVAIIVTAHASTESARSVLSAGAWQIVSKPVDFSKLFGLVREALDQPLLLLVDDDRDLCQSMWDVLRQQGIRCCLAHSVDEAAKMLKERAYAVALVDMRLPGGDGCDVVDAVHELNGDTRVVVVTGYRTEVNEQIRKAVSQGAHAVCYKPLDIDNLLATVRTLITE
jgi:two-component system response regulator HydG